MSTIYNWGRAIKICLLTYSITYNIMDSSQKEHQHIVSK